MKSNIAKFAIALALPGVVLLFFGCDGIINPPDLQGVDETVRSMSYFHQPVEMISAEKSEPLSQSDPDYPDMGPDPAGYYVSVRKVKDAPGFDEHLLLNPATDVIWLGSIVDGNTITSGAYKPITVRRGPLTFSISIPMGTSSVMIDQASLSSVREGIKDIVTSPVLSGAPANVAFDLETVHSESQLQIAAGVHFHGWGASFKSMFNYDDTNVASRTLVKFLQVYYTLDIDIPQDPKDFFSPDVTWNDLRYHISGDVSPVYVSSVKYGRMALFSVESSSSSEEVKLALQFAYDGIIAGGGADFEMKCRNVLQSSVIKARIYGGSGESAVKSINGFDGFKEWVTGGGEFSAASPGAPLSYTLRYLKDNTVSRVVLASEYYERTCVPFRNKYRVTLVNLEETVGTPCWGEYTISVITGYAGEGDLTNHTYKPSDGVILDKYQRYNLGKTDDFTFDPAKLDTAYVKIKATFKPISAGMMGVISLPDTKERSISISEVMNAATPGDDPTGLYNLHIYPKCFGNQCNLKLNFRIEPIE